MMKYGVSGAASARLQFSRVWLCCGLALAGCAITAPGHDNGAAGSGGSDVGGEDTTAAAGGKRASGGASADLGCEPASRRCSADTPQACSADGTWADESACPVGQACSGAGVCAVFRLVSAGIGTLGERPAEPVSGATLILKEQTLSAAPRACSDKLCITGDLR